MINVGDWVASSNPNKPDDTYIDILVDGRTFAKGKYPDLERVKPSWVQGSNLVIPDISARFFRQANGTYTQDKILEDAIRNITGDFNLRLFAEYGPSSTTDVSLYRQSTRSTYLQEHMNFSCNNSFYNSNSKNGVGFDASRVVPTAEENRPKMFAVKYYLKAIDADYNAVDYLYPVGSVYMCFDEISPKDKFKYGEWEEITGKMLIGVDPDDSTMSAPGMTGGSKEVQLTVEQLPEHDHDVTVPTLQWPDEQQKVQTAGYSAKHHSMLASKSGKTGKNQPINVMNPFIAVHMWRRTA